MPVFAYVLCKKKNIYIYIYIYTYRLTQPFYDNDGEKWNKIKRVVMDANFFSVMLMSTHWILFLFLAFPGLSDTVFFTSRRIMWKEYSYVNAEIQAFVRCQLSACVRNVVNKSFQELPLAERNHFTIFLAGMKQNAIACCAYTHKHNSSWTVGNLQRLVTFVSFAVVQVQSITKLLSHLALIKVV